jgi:hypothetical protein
LDDTKFNKRYNFAINVFWDKFKFEGIADVKFFKGMVEEKKFILKQIEKAIVQELEVVYHEDLDDSSMTFQNYFNL